jgi:hypothetical protein
VNGDRWIENSGSHFLGAERKSKKEGEHMLMWPHHPSIHEINTWVGPRNPSKAKEREPTKTFQREAGGGRKAMPSRRVFDGIVIVRKTGCEWKALSKERFGRASSVHNYFRQWFKARFFLTSGVKDWLSMMIWKALHGNGGVSMDRSEPDGSGEKGKQASYLGGRAWRPAGR